MLLHKRFDPETEFFNVSDLVPASTSERVLALLVGRMIAFPLECLLVLPVAVFLRLQIRSCSAQSFYMLVKVWISLTLCFGNNAKWRANSEHHFETCQYQDPVRNVCQRFLWCRLNVDRFCQDMS